MRDAIHLERTYPHPIEQVWAAIATPEALAQWLMPNDFALVKGHKFRFQAPPQPGFDGTVHCEVVDFAVPHRLQYRWQGGPMKVPTLVTFELSEVPEGTRLRFTHSGFAHSLGGYIARFILGNGWKKLLRRKIPAYLST